MIIAPVGNALEMENFRKNFEALDMGVEVEESTILQDIYGSLGIRNFAPEETLPIQGTFGEGLGFQRQKARIKKRSSLRDQECQFKVGAEIQFC